MRPLFAVVGIRLALIALAGGLVACGGGGGTTAGGGSAVTPIGPPSAAQTATPAPINVSGKAVEYASGVALPGFSVVIGTIPVMSTCLSTESNSAMPCGVPNAPTYTGTTAADGSFSVTVPAGTFMLTIGNGAAYATLHRSIIVTASGLPLGTVKIAALSSDEQAWLADVNTQRATVSVPTSFSNLTIDEYAEEQARAEVAAIVNGSQPYGDVTEGVFAMNYSASPGALYDAGGVADLVGGAGQYLTADAAWFGEKANCQNGNWQTCTVAENTGHYINLASTNDVWIGLGESQSSFNDPPYGNEWAYAALIPHAFGSAPALLRRFDP